MKRPARYRFLPPRSGLPRIALLAGGAIALTLPSAAQTSPPRPPDAPVVSAPRMGGGSGTPAAGVAPSFTLEEAPPPKPPKPKPGDGEAARPARPRTRPSAKSSVSAAPPGGFSKADPSNALSAPSISPKSMCEEVRRTLAEYQKNDARREEERRQLADQKAALDKLAAEVAKARADLAAETTRLVELAKKTSAEKAASRPAEQGDKAAGEKAAAKPAEVLQGARGADETASRRADGKAAAPSAQTVKAAKEVAEKIRYTRPRQAADIVRSLDPALAALVVSEMSPEFAGKVLEKRDKLLAADLLRRGVALEEKP